MRFATGARARQTYLGVLRAIERGKNAKLGSQQYGQLIKSHLDKPFRPDRDLAANTMTAESVADLESRV